MTRILVLIALLGLVAGCSKSPPPTEPEGGYLAFREALLSRNPDNLWLTLSEDTQDLVRSSLESMESTNQLIERLQPSDQKQAREAIGAALLDEIQTPVDLFRFVFVQENIPTDSMFRLGLEVDSFENIDEDRAIVTTRSAQEIELLKDEDGYWRVRNPVHELFAEAFAVMEENRANVETAINLFSESAGEDAEIARLLGISPRDSEESDDVAAAGDTDEAAEEADE